MKDKKEERKGPGTALAATSAAGSNLPEYLRPAPNELVRPGLENVERADMTLPRLGLCQSMTPQRKKSEPKFIVGLEEGQYFNTITQQVYGGKVRVVPLYFFKSNLFFNPIDEGGGIRCQAQDARHGVGDPGGECARCPNLSFGKDGEKPLCSKFYNYACLVLPPKGQQIGPEGLTVLSFKSTGLKIARDFNALVRIRGTALFAGVYELTSVEAKNKQGSWYQPVIQPAGWVDEPTYRVAQMLYQSVREVATAGRLRVDPEDPIGGGREPGDEGPEGM